MKFRKLIIELMVMISLLFGLINMAFADISIGLVAYYPFDGDINDYSGKNNNFKVVHNVTATADRFGNADKAYHFDGSSSFIQYPNHTWLNVDNVKGFTVATWFRIDNLGSDYLDLIDKSHGAGVGGWVVQGQSSDYSPRQIDFGISYEQNSTTNLPGNFNGLQVVTPSAGEWHHLAATFVNHTFAIYLDGKLENSITVSGELVYNDGDLYIGKHCDLGRYFNGALDDVRIYERALSSADIRELANVPLPGALWLLGLGLLRLAGWSKFKKK